MDHGQRCAKSFSCESLFIERPSLKRKHTLVESGNNVSYKNDDSYLINCNELIRTCQEVLLENEQVINAAAKDLNGFVSNSDHRNQVKSANGDLYKEGSIVEFSKWLNLIEQQLNTTCYCSMVQCSASSNECSLSDSSNDQKDWSDVISEHKCIQSEVESVGRCFTNAIKLSGNGISKSLLASEERRWHSLWLKSLEYLMILEECNTCPKHYSSRESNSEQLATTPPKRHKLNCKTVGSTPEVYMKNRRIQTTMVGSNQDCLDFRGAKFEIIQKDIGYSSDADMSDACEAHQCAEYINVSARGTRKRHVRRRRTRVPRRRPWSFHSDWTDWDYYQPPFCYTAECKSSEDFNSYDESVVRNLIEFGENYEFWMKNDDDAIIRASTPAEKEFLIETTEEATLEKVDSSVETVCEEEEEKIKISKKTSRRSSTSKVVYVALSMFVLLMTTIFTYLPPHVQRSYPQRPPPI